MKNPQTIRVLIEQRSDWWIAQCLEFDLATQARTLRDLQTEMARLLVAHIAVCVTEGIAPFECLPPAPEEYWDKYNRSETGAVPIAPRRMIAEDSLPAGMLTPQLPETNWRICA